MSGLTVILGQAQQAGSVIFLINADGFIFQSNV